MTKIDFVYPNISGIKQRGGFDQRFELAKELGCRYIEMPGDFIKNKTEVEKTGLEICSITTQDAIEILYDNESRYLDDIKYILHTEPSLRRNDGYGLSSQAPLKWYDKEWRDRFVQMVLDISAYLGKTPDKIEIHPGDRRNSNEYLIESVKCLIDSFESAFNVRPDVLLENRTGQFIQEGKGMADLWSYVIDNEPEISEKFGIVLDIQQLYTVTKNKCLNSFDLIPPEAIKGFHIHTKHRSPTIDDEIPWKEIFERIRGFEHDFIINPEIHHRNRVRDVIEFCKGIG